MTTKVNMFDRLLFSNRLGRITTRDVDYWRMMFHKILKVGEEFEVVIPENMDRGSVFRNFRNEFNPTESLDYIGEHGVHSVVEDGSVPNGMELITVGRRFNWKNFYEMNTKIMQKFQSMDIYTSNHTGFHIHLLAGYSPYNNTNELERNVPEIILANFYQLHRIFAPELYWIASGGSQRSAITRYILFRRPPFDYSPMQISMSQIKSHMDARYGKYQMVNMNPMHFDGRDISKFHLEIRHPDTHLSPAYSTALVALEVAILNKAIEISQCGLISMKQDEYDFRRELFDKFANLGTGDRESDSTELTDEDIDKLGIMTSEMVRWFKSEIVGISPVAYEILQTISMTPASIMRINGKSWRRIEEAIYPQELMDTDNVNRLTEIIILQQITDCDEAEIWLGKVANRLDVEMGKVNELISTLNREKIVVWDKEIGSMMFKQVV